MFRKHRFECPNCGWEGHVASKGAPVLLWVVLVALLWNAWLFQHAHMYFEALLACIVSLSGAWVTSKLPRWIICPACKWKHPLGQGEPH